MTSRIIRACPKPTSGWPIMSFVEQSKNGPHEKTVLMKIAVITTSDKPTSKSSVMREAALMLSEKGATVDMLNPEERAVDLANIKVEYDLYILKSSSQSAI